MKWSFPCGDRGLLKTITITFKKIRITIYKKNNRHGKFQHQNQAFPHEGQFQCGFFLSSRKKFLFWLKMALWRT